MQIKISNAAFTLAGLPTFSISQAELDAFNVANLVSWLEFDAGLFSSDRSTVTDRKTGLALPIVGGSVAALVNGMAALQLTGSQKVRMGNLMPLNGDFTRMVVARPDVAQDSVYFGNDDVTKPWNLLYAKPGTTGEIGFADGSAGNTLFFSGTGSVAPTNAPKLVIETYAAATKTHKIYVTDYVTPIKTQVGNGQNTDPTLNLGMCVPLTARPSLMSFAAAMVVQRDLSADATGMAALAGYLKTKFGV